MQTGCSEREGRRRLIDSSSSSSKEDNALFKPPFLLSLFLPLFFPSGGAPSVFLSPRARATSRKPKHSTYTLFGQISLSLSLRERRASLSNSSQKCPKLSNSTLKKNSKKHFFQPTRKSMDLDEAMKHFARISARCCDKARSGRDPWVNGGALE